MNNTFLKDTESNQLVEQPEKREIVKVRNSWEKTKVFLSWWLIWNTLHQIGWDLIFTIVIASISFSPNESQLQGQKQGRILLGAGTSVAHIHLRMKRQAQKRWQEKYSTAK